MFHSLFGRLPSAVVLLATCFFANSILAQPTDRYKAIPGDSLAITSLDVDAILGVKDLELVPWEIISAFGKQELGVDPLLVTSIDMCSGMPGPTGPEYGVVIKTKAPVDIASLSSKLFSEVVVSPQKKEMRFRNFNNAPMKIVQTEPQSLMVGSEGTLRRMLGGHSKPGKAIELLGRSKDPVRSIMMLEPLRPIILGALSDSAASIPPQFVDDLQIVAEELDYIQTSSKVALSTQMSVRLGTKNADSAKKLYDALNRLRKDGLIMAEALLSQQVEQDPQLSEEVRASILQYLKRMKLYLSTADLMSVANDEVLIDSQFSYSTPTIGVLVGLLLPAVQAAREAARRMQSSNNLRQIVLSLHNYDSAHRSLPVRTIKDKSGKPLLSWRVNMLPYLEQSALYNEFHLDEAWDSPHNIKLLDRMPATFKHPSYVGPEGNTVYLAPYMSGTVWTSDKPRLSAITDGTSNTIAIIEVKNECAVPWTKPEDLDLDDMDLADCFRPVSSQAAFFDGSVRVLPEYLVGQPETLDALVTSSGGEIVDLP